MLRRLLGRPSISLIVGIVTSLLSVRNRVRRLKPVHHHATGDCHKDQRACDQDHSDDAKAAEHAAHHVITNYQRRPLKERSLEG